MTKFAIVMGVLFVVPLYCKRWSIPPIVGLMLCGIAFAPNGIHLFPKDSTIANFFGELGKLMLMLFAGLETDLDDFTRSRKQCLIFGLLTFSLPLAGGYLIASHSGYQVIAAILIGSLLASHTLLAFPLVVGYQTLKSSGQRLLDEPLVNTVIVLMVVTAVMGPVLTGRFLHQHATSTPHQIHP